MVQGPARRQVQQAESERKKARQAETEAQRQREQALQARHGTADQRDQAVASEKATRRSQHVNKAVLAFLKDNLFATEHRKRGGNEVTLRQAVDAAEAKVAEAFADRPLGEASIREILGFTYRAMGDSARAVPQLERSLALREAELGPDVEASSKCRNELAVAYRNIGRDDDASRLYNQNRLTASHAAALTIQGSALLAEKKPAAAELKLRESVAIRRTIRPDDWITFDAQSMLGEALLEQKKFAGAEPLLLSGYEGMKQREAKIPARDRKPRLTTAVERLVRLYEAWGKPDQAAKWRKELEEVKPAKKL